MKMAPLTTTDNSILKLENISEDDLANLKELVKPSISSLCRDEHPNLLIFPPDLGAYGDKIGEQKIITITEDAIETGNVMGFIGYRGTKLRIKSRFTEKDGNDYFLHYMLQKVLSINLFDLKYDSDRESIFDFLIYLFPAYLKRAIRQGVYKEYQTRRYNDSNVKGRIDINRHIRCNTPFAGNVAYSTREYAIDNHVTQLIRHTIDYISNHKYCGGILHNDEETAYAVSMIYEATPSYSYRDRGYVVNQNLRSVSHPYYLEYLPLQKLCLQILRHEEMKYGNDKDDEIYGILFDGAWLWEEYLDTILKKFSFIHPRNRTDNKGKMFFVDPRKVLAQPDFYIENRIVLDAKYKRHKGLFDEKQREDRFQLLAYMHIFNANVSGLIVPVTTDSEKLNHGIINGRGGIMHLIGMEVDRNVDNIENYRKYMAYQENNLIHQIENIIISS